MKHLGKKKVWGLSTDEPVTARSNKSPTHSQGVMRQSMYHVARNYPSREDGERHIYALIPGAETLPQGIKFPS